MEEGDLGSPFLSHREGGGGPSVTEDGIGRRTGGLHGDGEGLEDGSSPRACFLAQHSKENLMEGSVDLEHNKGLHGPVHGSTHKMQGTGGGHCEDLMRTDSSVEIGEKIFHFRDDPMGRSNGKSIDNEVEMVNVWNALTVGMFHAGSDQAEAVHVTFGRPGVRPMVSAKNIDGEVSATSLTGDGVMGSQPKHAWNKRPTVVKLPGRAELGEEAVRAGRVQLDVEEVLSTVKKFDAALVGRLFGRRLSFDYLNAELHRRWNGFGNFKLVTVSGECFVCFFDSVESRDAVLVGGPWVVAGQVIGVDCWTPSFSPSSNVGFITPVWVRLPSLPMYCWSGKNIARIAALLGEPIFMDAATDRLERGHYARVCVRLDLSQPLRPGMWVDGPYGSFFQNVEYEGLSTFCFICGHVGHKAEWCRSKSDGSRSAAVTTRPVQEVGDRTERAVKPAEVADNQREVEHPVAAERGQGEGAGMTGASVQQAGVEDPHPSDCLGPWMLVERRRRPPRGGQGRIGNSKANAQAMEGPRLPRSRSAFGGGEGQRVDRKKHVHIKDSPQVDAHAPSNSDAGGGFGQSGGSGSAPCGGKIKGSKTFAEHQVSNLGPITQGSRNKRRRQAMPHDGGVASPFIPK